jgi:hypothetical protein
VACAALVACAMGGAKKSAVSGSPAPTAAEGGMGAMPGQSPEHDEIARLDQAITDELAKRNLAPAPEASCGATCDLAPVAMDARPIADDPNAKSCKPAPSDTCKDSCTLSDSICKNAERICTLAKQLGEHDAYANDKCVRGSASCKQSKDRCCGCL